MKEIGIIGFGNFGQFMACHLKPYFLVFAYDTRDLKKQANELGVTYADVATVASRDILIFSMPVQFLEQAVETVKKHVKPNVRNEFKKVIDELEKSLDKE